MKKLFTLPILLAAVLSCNNPVNSDPHEKIEETPQVLINDGADYSGSWKSRSYESSIINRLYNEMLEKDKALKSLDDKIRKLGKEQNELHNVMQEFDNNSKEYYTEALYMAHATRDDVAYNTIKDTLLRATLTKIIMASHEKYEKEIAELKKDFEELYKRNVALSDYHMALKIVTTLPGMEAYQKNEQPNQTAAKELINKLDNTIGVIDDKIKNLH